MSMDESRLKELRERAPGLAALYVTGHKAITAAADVEALEQTRVSVLGRKSPLTEMLRSISTLPADERPVIGKFGNVVRVELEALVESREAELASEALQASLAGERVDVTLPGVPLPLGHEHLITQTIREVEDIFVGLGYQVADGPEIETDYYNFTALNTPEDHPARSSHDTFFVDAQTAGAALAPAGGGAAPGLLLRTQTSPVQVRVMEAQEPPIYVICPGRVYRRDLDATHTPMFHQVEGLAIDEGITMADLKGTLHHFAREFFGADREIRLRPHFFPFTEPSVEVDVRCLLCGGEGCRSCNNSGWLEILGAGMVDPNLYGYVSYDAERLQGFAFGMGVERMAMLKHGVPDLRALYDNDLRFLEQF
jgi:phenylalanyl-tRNA synthetase alpha chain